MKKGRKSSEEKPSEDAVGSAAEKKTFSFEGVVKLVKDVSVLFGAVSAVVGVLLLIVISVFKDPFRAFFKEELLHAISNRTAEEVKDIAASSSDDREVFRREILLTLSNDNDDFVNELMQRSEDQNVIEILRSSDDLNTNLSNISNKLSELVSSVDAVYVFKLSQSSTPRFSNGQPVVDENENPKFDVSQNLSGTFFATERQTFEIRVQPLSTSREFKRRLGRGEAQLVLKIGGEDLTRLKPGGLKRPITCEVRNILDGLPASIVPIDISHQAGVKNSDWYDVDIVITAYKGGSVDC